MEITNKILDKIVDEQLVTALGLVTLNGKPHCTPVWTNHFKGKLYIFSKSGRAKEKYARANPECMIAFDYASLRGTIEIFSKGSPEYTEVKDLPDRRYGHLGSLKGYKENWDIVFRITPYKLY